MERGGLPHLAIGGGYPLLRSGWGGYPFPGLDGGTPFPGLDRGDTPFAGPRSGWRVPPHPRSGQGDRNIAVCTCYAAGGMPLAFMQEDFLVLRNFHNSLTSIFQPNFGVNYGIGNVTESSVIFRNAASAFIGI